LIGITGPRQFEFPPNIALFDSAGEVAERDALAAGLEDERILEMVARERRMPYWPRNSFSSKVDQDTLELVLGERRKEPPSGMTDEPVDGRGHMRDYGGMTLLEELDQLQQLGVTCRKVAVEHRTRAERQEPNQRTDLEPERFAIGQSEHVVVEAVLFVPHVVLVLARPVHGVGDPDEVLEKLERDLCVHRVVLGKGEGHLQHALAIEGHPGRSVSLFEGAPGGKRGAAIEDTDVVESEKPSCEDVPSVWILPVYPPVEVEHQALERALQKVDVLPSQVLLEFVEEHRRPGVHRRVHIAEVPPCGDLPVGVTVEAP
jgi:hypothetical protein